MKVKIFSAAGGNSTAILYDLSCSKIDYAFLNSIIQKAYPEVEQVGFFEKGEKYNRLQMAGGEFCGNSTRSFACLLSELDSGKKELIFEVSGFDKPVRATVERLGDDSFYCSAEFAGLSGNISKKQINGKDVFAVDLGGIVHILIDEKFFPIIEKTIKDDMKNIKNLLGVDSEAVGVIWIREEGGDVYIRPVVWVKSINTCFDETSCGSGTIAVALLKKKNVSVVQPSGEKINVYFKENSLVLSSKMKKTFSL
ncbi:MAG: hypothetical protein US83_C0003G0063 [Candidatus Falkowbacteria bacterium GW2011_GWC2_38_22]|uniref:Diaminopimelate epimerase n=1 Tax=Candidatus Falkowbacteria bacterium GW2011_GWE1_38_31 TaxID=1618638 RepID=A0A0G0JUM8_9BACT|nr:MAG: hypothetical protein US73_C0001G0155 [Candidatus Falkowbacteria bacterium GW2011_GWF2_38_1205]KKQ61814.1 MAG: hypothetical protein US83_C0003G0063 [Candidatus Falkowbacteria bacterium GW2011_GWC2_38_22]KKQ64122.1 MAG: hypothetical protein US84_C0002G0154 [Candidatus Falkowbacteria bacterium GW2011_GWF1_38_22]KKQ66528.1 MAG: hypothetical protein US87_C0001G0049 [Candidatus Falkowbacteria bacterium GW2011_GWE2_38_254]KKQ71228.1 MAG: hypothetical protein US91_C0001G0155 [Candidatus Falkowb